MTAIPAASPVAPRPLSSMRRKSDVLDHLVRSGVVKLYAHVNKMQIEQARHSLARKHPRYDDETTKVFCDYVARGDADPAMTDVPGWAAELVGQSYVELIKTLPPLSAFAQLAGFGTSLNFGRAGLIGVPNFTPSVGGAFVKEGDPIPVAQGDTSGQFLTRKKIAVIIGFTRELDEGSIQTFEALARMRLRESTAIVLDSCLLDAEPGTDVRPPGLLNGAITIPSSGTLQVDLQQVTEAVTRGYTRNLILIMHPVQALSLPLGQYKLPLIVSSLVPIGTVIAIDAADFVSVGSDVPRFEICKEATLHFEDELPRPISNGGVASPVRSLWQTDTISLRMVLNVDWCLRRSTAVAKTIFTQDFTMPTGGAIGVAHVRDARGFEVGQRVWNPETGYYEVVDKDED